MKRVALDDQYKTLKHDQVWGSCVVPFSVAIKKYKIFIMQLSLDIFIWSPRSRGCFIYVDRSRPLPDLPELSPESLKKLSRYCRSRRVYCGSEKDLKKLLLHRSNEIRNWFFD